MTVENLAQWLTENAAEKIQHENKIELTPEYIQELEHKSSAASRSIDRLKNVEKEFKNYLKKGTPVNPNAEVGEGDEPEFMPIDITIPPTRGLDILNERRAWADKQIEDGFKIEITELYLIPYPEKSMMCCLDIEAREWETYTREMTAVETEVYGNLFKEGSEEKTPKAKRKATKKKNEEESFIPE